jgi:hypothetical protein
MGMAEKFSENYSCRHIEGIRVRPSAKSHDLRGAIQVGWQIRYLSECGCHGVGRDTVQYRDEIVLPSSALKFEFPLVDQIPGFR